MSITGRLFSWRSARCSLVPTMSRRSPRARRGRFPDLVDRVLALGRRAGRLVELASRAAMGASSMLGGTRRVTVTPSTTSSIVGPLASTSASAARARSGTRALRAYHGRARSPTTGACAPSVPRVMRTRLPSARFVATPRPSSPTTLEIVEQPPRSTSRRDRSARREIRARRARPDGYCATAPGLRLPRQMLTAAPARSREPRLRVPHVRGG